jgi:preprotein translocase SecF subunit
LFRNQRWDLVSKRGLYYVISGLMLAIGMAALLYKGLNLGIDFTGGSKVGVVTVQHIGGKDREDALSKAIEANLDAASISGYSVRILPGVEGGLRDGIEVSTPKREDIAAAAPAPKPVEPAALVAPATPPAAGTPATATTPPATDAPATTPPATTPEPAVAAVPAPTEGKTVEAGSLSAHSAAVLKAMEDAAKAQNIELTRNTDGKTVVNSENVSGIIQDQLITNSVLALVFGSLLIMGWIWIRYNIGGLGLRYSVSGILALLHDLATLIGIFALSKVFFGDQGLVVNSPFIAALLTVLGYSIHDTIIIFDRIRENMRLRKGRTFAETVNISLLETLARSVNTILTVVLTLVALLLLGGPSLRDFVAAMLIGVMIGGYSSIFVASQLLVSWSKGRDREMPAFDGTIAMDAPVPAMAAAGPAAIESAGAGSTDSAMTAIQRAKLAGKTSKRKR